MGRSVSTKMATITTVEYDVDKLLSLWRGQPILWDLSHQDYKKYNKKPLVWQKIAAGMGPDWTAGNVESIESTSLGFSHYCLRLPFDIYLRR